MQQIEPTGQLRLEWYLARLTAVVASSWGGGKVDWRDFLIGYEKPQQTMEQAMAVLNRFDQQFDGNNNKS